MTRLLPLAKKYIKKMTKKERIKAQTECFLAHWISIYMISLIYEAKERGKDRFGCVLSLSELADIFEGETKKAILEDLRQLEVEQVDFPLRHYVPTEDAFNWIVKAIQELEELKGKAFMCLTTKNVSIHAVQVMEEHQKKRRLIETKDVKIGHRIPMLRTCFMFKDGKFVGFHYTEEGGEKTNGKEIQS